MKHVVKWVNTGTSRCLCWLNWVLTVPVCRCRVSRSLKTCWLLHESCEDKKWLMSSVADLGANWKRAWRLCEAPRVAPSGGGEKSLSVFIILVPGSVTFISVSVLVASSNILFEKGRRASLSLYEAEAKRLKEASSWCFIEVESSLLFLPLHNKGKERDRKREKERVRERWWGRRCGGDVILDLASNKLPWKPAWWCRPAASAASADHRLNLTVDAATLTFGPPSIRPPLASRATLMTMTARWLIFPHNPRHGGRRRWSYIGRGG